MPQDGGRFVSLMHRPLLPPGNAPGTCFGYRLSRPQGHSAIWRIMSMKNSNGTSWDRTNDLPILTQHLSHCATAVPTPAPLLHTKNNLCIRWALFKRKPSHISERSTCSSLNLVSGLCKSNVGWRRSLSGADHVSTNSRSHMNNSSLRHLKRPWVERFIEIYFDRILQTLPAKLIQNLKPCSCSAYCKSMTCEIQLCQQNSADIPIV